jgi:CRISPR-associated endonuclease/helicase Cas3
VTADALTSEDFPEFFQAVWGYEPFPWQADLVQRLATGRDPRRGDAAEPGKWPDALDLPTGSGKTAALDIAVFHLALEAARGEGRRAPVRIAFVVDRRLIVDDAFTRAERLCRALQWALLDDEQAKALTPKDSELAAMLYRVRAASVVKRVALQLRRLAGDDQPPLLARSLRGGAPREDDWARTPVQPTILCSTVDQVGSRLLFRGYGVSDSMKPIHAGLLGSDCLILLDEAHLSEPFRQTLKAIKRLRTADAAPFSFALLTATPSRTETDCVFGLSADDHAHPILRDRINASKLARLVEIAGAQGVDTESRRVEATVAEIKSVLTALRAGGNERPAVGVVVNRVARARAVFERLKKELESMGKDIGQSSEPTIDFMLVVGAARSVDRNEIAKKLDPIRTRQAKAPRGLPRPLIVVATQTIEAGVDIDFDGLVTEAAALDALRQRFGRLNRAGRRDITPEAVVLVHREDIGAKADDPVYGDRIAKTWEALNRWKANAADARVDFGVEAMKTTLATEKISDLTTKALDAPVLLPAYADLWSQTSPIPGADPDVALFLHGPNRSPASVQIVWRADISEREDLRPAAGQNNDPSWLTELFTLTPPRAAEAIEVPLWATRAWLRGAGVQQSDFADVIERETDSDNARTAGRLAFRWAGKDSERTGVIRADALRPGDLIVVPASYGGCDRWGWCPAWSNPVTDVADDAAWPYRTRRFAVRVTAELMAASITAGAHEDEQADPVALEALRKTLSDVLTEHKEDGVGILLEKVRQIVSGRMRDRLDALTRLPRRKVKAVFAYRDGGPENQRGVVFAAPTGLGGAEEELPEDMAARPATESDDLSWLSDQPCGLVAHCEDARDWATMFARSAGLPSRLAEDVRLAAFLHDAGKADPRFQAYFAGGDPYGPDAKEALAKSGQRRLPHRAWEQAGLPSHWRHEALSVRIARRLATFESAEDAMLVLWLIGSHHGHGRPLFPHADTKDAEARPGLLKACGGEGDLKPDPGPQSLAFEFNGLDWVQMFEALKARYGIWGLARLEAFLRLADHRASEAGALPEVSRPYKEAAE